jgi:hypothetical protein
MLEIKEFYNLVCKKQNVTKIVEYAFVASPEAKSQSSQNAALAVLNTLVQLFRDKHKSGGDASSRKNRESNEDDDDIIMQNSDEEEESQESPLIEALKENAKHISQYLETSAPSFLLENSYDSRQ